MIAAFMAYIKTITALTIFSALTEMLLPESRQRRYAQLILGLFILTAVLQPLFQLMGAQAAFEAVPRWEQSEYPDTYKNMENTNEG